MNCNPDGTVTDSAAVSFLTRQWEACNGVIMKMVKRNIVYRELYLTSKSLYDATYNLQTGKEQRKFSNEIGSSKFEDKLSQVY